MVALGPGGIADKQGNTYENRYLCKLLIRLIKGEIRSIVVEPKDYSGTEYVVSTNKEETICFQCKSSNSNLSWTENSLKNIDFFKHSKEIILSGKNIYYYIVSPISKCDFDSLCKQARNSPSLTEMRKALTKGQNKLLDHISKEYELEITDPAAAEKLFCILQHCNFVTFNDDGDFLKEQEERIEAILTGNPYTNRVLLENLTNDQAWYGKPVTATNLLAFLESKNIHIRDNTIPSAHLKRLNENFKNGILLINDHLIKRPITNKILSRLSDRKLLLVHGGAGTGKSGCIIELIEKLEEERIPYLAISLDKYIPRNSSKEFGESLQLGNSPTYCLNDTADGNRCVLILDQLDSLRWSNDHSATAIDVCKELIREACSINHDGGNLSIVLASRTIDFENDDELKSLLYFQEQESFFEKIEIPCLTEDETKNIIGNDFDYYSKPLRNLLQIPFALRLWSELEDKPSEIRSLFDLIGKWWDNILTQGKKSGITNSEISTCKDEIIRYMRTHKKMTMPYYLGNRHITAIKFLSSYGLLSSVYSNIISFTHQGFLDYFISLDILTEIEQGKALPEIVASEDQLPAFRYRLMLVLQNMLVQNEDYFLRQCKDMLGSSTTRYYIKCAVFDVLGQCTNPSSRIFEFIDSYFASKEWHGYIIRTVYFNHPVYIRRFFSAEKEFTLSDPLDQNLLSSISEQDPDYVTELLMKYMGKSQEDAQIILQTICHDPADDSESMFSLRLRIYRTFPALFYLVPLWINLLMERNTERAIQLLIAFLDSNLIEDDIKIHFDLRNYINRLSIEESEIIIEQLFPVICRHTIELETPWPFGHPVSAHNFYRWCNYDNHHSIYRDLVELVKEAAKEIVGINGCKSIEPLITCLDKSIVWQEIISYAILCLPESEADYAIGWLISDFRKNAFVFTFDMQDYLSYTKQIITKFEAKCRKELSNELENIIYEWKDPKDMMLKSYRSRLDGSHRKSSAPFWGFLQVELLPLLNKPSKKTEELINVLNRRYKEKKRSPYHCGAQSKVFYPESPFKEQAEKFDDKTWLRLIADNSIWNDSKSNSTRYRTDFSKEGFMYDIYRQAKLQPERFARLSLRFPDDCYHGYIISILRAISSSIQEKKEIDILPICCMIEKYMLTDDEETIKSILRLIEKGANYDWTENVLSFIRDKASIRNNITPMITNKPNDLLTDSLNTIQGCAFYTIAALLYEHQDYFEIFKSAFWADRDEAADFAALNALLPCYSIEKEFSITIFKKIIKRNPMIFCSPVLWELLACDFSNSPRFYLRKLFEACKKNDSRLKQAASSIICAIAVYNSNKKAFKWIIKTKRDEIQQKAICKQAIYSLRYENSFRPSKEILMHIAKTSRYALSEFEDLFSIDKMIKSDTGINDLIVMLMSSPLGKTDGMIFAFLKFLNKSSDDISIYISVINEIASSIHRTADSYQQQHITENLIKCISKMTAYCIKNNKDLNSCLNAWDEIYRYSILRGDYFFRLYEKYNNP